MGDRRTGGLALLCAVALLGGAERACAHDAVVRSFDGTPLVVHLYEAAGPRGDVRAPTVLVGPGFPQPGNTDPARTFSDQIGVPTLRGEGYNVVTWDPRGLGGSGGKVMFAAAGYEGRDVQAVVDWLAQQPEALLDAPGDPRVGMSGSSYGGAIQFVAAAIDGRIDAIVPDVAWHSLERSFFPEGAAKLGWLASVCGNGVLRGTLDGLLFGPAGVQVDSVDAALVRGCVEGIAGGAPSAATRRWFADRDVSPLLGRIRAPALITQGTVDTLFALGEGIRNYEALRAAGVPVKMMWHCGGHGPCRTGIGTHAHLAHAGLAWLARWLRRDATVDTGPGFEWVADDARWRSAPAYPLPPGGTLDAAGSGTLLVSPADAVTTAGALFEATPAANAVNLDFPPAPEGDLVGAPVVRISYRGTAVPARTLLFAQVVHTGANRVLGGQVTPIPVILDGRARTVERPLEVIAAHSFGAAPYRLQVTPATGVFGPQRSVGTVTLTHIAATLPVAGAAAAPVQPQLRRSRRPLLSVRTRRADAVARVAVRARLRSEPCSGRVRFTVRAGRITRTRTARVTRRCSARATLRLVARRGALARISARFEGNAELAARRARPVLRRL